MEKIEERGLQFSEKGTAPKGTDLGMSLIWGPNAKHLCSLNEEGPGSQAGREQRAEGLGSRGIDSDLTAQAVGSISF